MVRLINQAAFGAAALLSFATGSSAQDDSCANALKPNYTFPLARNGWRAQLITGGLSRPRGMIFDSKGALLVAEGTGITYFNIADNNGCISVENKKILINDTENYNHGIELSPDGRLLYISTPDQVHTWEYDAETVSVRNRKIIVTNMFNEDHYTRTLLLPAKKPDLLLVSRGSAANMDDLSIEQETGIAQLRAFNISSSLLSSSSFKAYDYPTEGTLIGWGLRNSVGVGEHPVTGGIYSVENSADGIHRLGVDIHNQNPGEEMNYHGRLDGSFPEGENYGYPHCFALYDPALIPENGTLQVGNNFALDNKEDINDETCNRDYVAPRLTFMAHMAPLDIKFSPSGDRGYISFHGSWNRDDPQGYKVSYVDWNRESGEPVAASTNNSATVDILRNADNSNCRDKGCFRPAGLLFDSKGRLFVTSDHQGEIWVLDQGDYTYPDQTQTDGGSGTQTGDEPAEASTSSPAVRAVGGVRTEGWLMVGLTVVASFVGGVWLVIA
ncbi:soluble quino protein glucose/sorbosone dehydrogenase [Cladorrhinum sp. PSN259]|nr:soluble quino protein glucose/sorbosone dehydrogenase [Cladorrhinum sp. PSN259]